MKVCLYAGEMNFKRNYKKYVEIQNIGYFGNKKLKTLFFLVPMFYTPKSCSASVMF